MTTEEDDADFYELVKFVEEYPEVSEEELQMYWDQGMWPDKAREHVAYYQSKDKAEEQKQRMEESSDMHTSSKEDGGWFAVISPCMFDD
jgi:hypothetical protein